MQYREIGSLITFGSAPEELYQGPGQ